MCESQLILPTTPNWGLRVGATYGTSRKIRNVALSYPFNFSFYNLVYRTQISIPSLL